MQNVYSWWECLKRLWMNDSKLIPLGEVTVAITVLAAMNQDFTKTVTPK